jgi:uncharacterized membrane protein YhaH (DUF805 family)
MHYWYRMGAWFVEMLIEAEAFILITVLMAGVEGHWTAKDILVLTVAALTGLSLSGYPITTMILRLALHGRRLHAYPVLAPLLFLAHFEVLNWLLMPEGAFAPHDRFVFRVFASAVVFVVAGALSLLLGRAGQRESRDTGTADGPLGALGN